jgi:hypothetical protein
MADGGVPQFEVGARPGLVEVHLVGLPIAAHQASTEHLDELRREFRLLEVQQADGDAPDVPSRLLKLVTLLEDRWASLVDSTGEDLEAAIDRGATTVDVAYRVPAGAKRAAEVLDALLDEADAYCRSGDTLLTLQASPEALAYRKWFLREFARQIDGQPPTPWSHA